MSIRVLLADDQELLRATFKLLLDATPGMEVVGVAGTGTQAVSRTRELHPDVVLMDIRMPELDGVAATQRITSDPTLSATRILILTTFETDELVVATIRAGASGFLGKGGLASRADRGHHHHRIRGSPAVTARDDDHDRASSSPARR